MDTKAHWQSIYQAKGPEQLSWFQAEAKLSRELIEQFAPDRNAQILDVGAGASTLVDGLLGAGYRYVTVLDLSPTALDYSRHRLGAVAAARVDWSEADVLTASLAAEGFDVWHDRAVFHFLTALTDREQYVAQVRRAVKSGGVVFVATFAEDGPTRCSGLETRRYSADTLHAEFGPDFRLIASQREEHVTPSGAAQSFTYCVCQYRPGDQSRSAA
jgi:SAM-dependent methyltransferase